VDDRFYGAFLPPSVRVCGRSLKKFTLWHNFLLSAIESPVAIGGDFLTVPQLLAAVEACTRPFGDHRVRPRPLDAWRRRRLTRDKDLFRREAETFYAWVAAHCKGPHYFRKSSGGSAYEDSIGGAGPQCLSLSVSLMSRANMSKPDAWNTSMGIALWIDFQCAQNEGVPLHYLPESVVNDNPEDVYAMSEESALAMFTRELPEELVQPSFERWKQAKEERNA
jgi:hypothetical protein